MSDDCRLILGDCLDALRTLPDASVDAVVTDPPYGMSNEAYDRGVDPEVWRECFRVAKPDAALISFAASATYHRIASDIEAAGWKVRQMWGWVYKAGVITSAWPKLGFDRLAPAMDPICFATKGRHLLNLDRSGDDAWSVPSRKLPGISARANICMKRDGVGRWPRSIVASDGIDGFQYFALTPNNRTIPPEESQKAIGHPNVKPLALMEWVVSKLAPGGTVLDPFMGSGTTGLACLATGRRFIGIERDPDYFAIAERRIAAARVSVPA
jgi:DNA modification methylase